MKISKSLIDGNQISFPWTLMDSIAAYWPGFHWNLSSIHSRLITGISKSKFKLDLVIPTLYKMRLRIRLWKGPFCEAIINHLENVENTGGYMKCPKKHLKDDFVMWLHLHNILKCPKIEEFYFRILFCFTIDHVLFSEMPHFLNLEIYKKKSRIRKRCI